MSQKNSSSRKKKSGVIDKLSTVINSYIPLIVLVMVLINVIVVYKFERDRKPQIKYMIATNLISRVDAPPVGTLPADSPVGSADGPTSGALIPRNNDSVNTNIVDGITNARNIYRAPYHYFMQNGCPHVEMYGRYYSTGSPTSRGIIVRIFPDAIILRDGSRIENLSSADVRHDAFAASSTGSAEGYKLVTNHL